MFAYLMSAAIMAIGLYALALRDNLIKKIMGLSIFSGGIHVLLISLGYRAGGIAPILSGVNFNQLAATMVDPLPQALVLTSIVINLSITAFALAIIVDVYRDFGTLDARKIREMKG